MSDFEWPQGWRRVEVSTLVYAMEDQADDILRSFALSEEDGKKYATVKSRFDNHFSSKYSM